MHQPQSLDLSAPAGYQLHLLGPKMSLASFGTEPCIPSMSSTCMTSPSSSYTESLHDLVGEVMNAQVQATIQPQPSSNAQIALHTTAPARPGYRCGRCEAEQSICRGVKGYRICENCYRLRSSLTCDWAKKQDEKQRDYMRAYRNHRRRAKSVSADGKKVSIAQIAPVTKGKK